MAIYLGSTEINNPYFPNVSEMYVGDTLIWPVGLPVGTTFNFDYTGNVQSVELPKGKYKLQCWGAQGGTSYGSSSATGSKGGYSEGVLTLTEKTTLYVFVGGKGSRGSSTSLVNGGWNGGGASVGYSSYSSSDTYGESYPACGGGATDIALETSSMSYSNGRTNRSAASLLSRIIVAGGGAGGSYAYQEVEEETTSSYYVDAGGSGVGELAEYPNGMRGTFSGPDASAGDTIRITIDGPYDSAELWNSGYTSVDYISDGDEITLRFDPNIVLIWGADEDTYISYERLVEDTTTETVTDSAVSNKAQQGGGTSGKGQYPGTQSAGGNGNGNDGGFGYGGNQTTTGYRYVSGGAGGGWYGGGTAKSDSSMTYVRYTGGGSGFVNTAANASYRPSGYTGLQLDSGTTTAGNTSHPSISGGTETGHSGNGYARIIALDEDGNYPTPEPTVAINWEVQSGSWNSSSNSSAADGVSYTCESPGSSGSTVIRCTFSGITSITFNCIYQGESNYDYLTVGSLDTTCTRSSYGTSLKGNSGAARDITFTCDIGEHYVEFCYSKDSSVDTSPDNATVYVKSYS